MDWNTTVIYATSPTKKKKENVVAWNISDITICGVIMNNHYFENFRKVKCLYYAKKILLIFQKKTKIYEVAIVAVS